MSSTVPLLDAAAVHRALDYPRLIERLRHAFTAGAEVPPRHVHALGADDRLLLMPAWRAGEAIGVKIVTVFPGNPARGAATVGALYLLLDGKTGHARALIDGEALTSRRTAAVSALAATFLARRDARTLLVVGTGQLAPYMAAAHRTVRDYRDVLFWGRDSTKAASLAAAIGAQAVTDLREALGRADVVTCATTSFEPIVHADMVRPGTHVDLVGAFTPKMRESDDALVEGASVFVDSYAGALREAGDLVQPIEQGRITAAHLRGELADLASGRHRGRSLAHEVTLFKSVGTALADLAAAELVAASST